VYYSKHAKQRPCLCHLRSRARSYFHYLSFHGKNTHYPTYLVLLINLSPDTIDSHIWKQGNSQATGDLVRNGVVTIEGPGAHVEIDDCIFFNNSFGDVLSAGPGYFSYAVSVLNSGGLVFKNSCLIGNGFIGPGPIVLNEGTFFVLIGGYADNMVGPLFCPFPAMAARFRNEEERINLLPQCVNNQADVCRASIFSEA
jgi:hypothetical protein